MSIGKIFQQYRGIMSATYALLLAETCVMVLMPMLIGMAIDGLLHNNWFNALTLVGVLLLGTLIGTTRRLLDTRGYGRIFQDLAVADSEFGWKHNIALSKLAARSDQIREFVDFLETDLTESLRASVNVIGALIMLAIMDFRLCIACLCAAALAGSLYALGYQHLYRLNKGHNDQLDQQVKHLSKGNPHSIMAHFAAMVRWRIRLSDFEARNFACVDFLLTGLILFSLWVTSAHGDPTPGSIFAVLAYVIEFGTGSYVLPLTFQQFVRIREIAERITAPQQKQQTTTGAAQ